MDKTEVEAIAIRQIDAGERLLWSGTPAPGEAASAALPATLIGVPFTGFAAFWIWSAWSMAPQAPGPFKFFPLFGVPFALIGLGMMLGPLWAWLRARNTVYALTERRAVIIVNGGGGGISSYARADMGELTRIERADGSGTVFFAIRTSTTSRGFVKNTRVGFIGIPDVRNVERLIREHVLGRAA
jgi:hypothetical protein